MNYALVYERLMADRRTKESSLTVFEKHHILPRHLGGTDEPDNLIRLSLQDHLFAHLLLGHIHGDHLAQCYLRMSGMKKYAGGRAARTKFESLRLAARQGLRDHWTLERRKERSTLYKSGSVETHPPGWAEKVSTALKGRAPSDATIEASRRVLLGRAISDEHRAKLRLARKGKTPMAGKRHSLETRQKMSESRQGKKRGPYKIPR